MKNPIDDLTLCWSDWQRRFSPFEGHCSGTRLIFMHVHIGTFSVSINLSDTFILSISASYLGFFELRILHRPLFHVRAKASSAGKWGLCTRKLVNVSPEEYRRSLHSLYNSIIDDRRVNFNFISVLIDLVSEVECCKNRDSTKP